MSRPAPLVTTTRSGAVESIHSGSVVVCDSDGRIVASIGDPDRFTFLRSCTKPIQASVSLRAIGEMPQDLLSLACGSHSGEPMHVKGVRRILRMAELPVSALGCPPDLPERSADAVAVGGRRSPVFHNCSGKHATMLLACVRRGDDPSRYLEARQPLQRAITAAVARATGEEPVIGVDGCGLPVHGVSLRGAATAFARLAVPATLGPLAATAAEATAAMRAHPLLMSGTGRSDARLITAIPGLVVKVGAEGLHCAAVLGAGLGVAVRIEDGAERASAPALLHALRLLGLAPAEDPALDPVARRRVTGGGRPVGEITASFRLRARR